MFDWLRKYHVNTCVVQEFVEVNSYNYKNKYTICVAYVLGICSHGLESFMNPLYNIVTVIFH